MPISKGGQISIPAEVRRRWGVNEVWLFDEGDRLAVLPVPDDPIAAAAGSLKGLGRTDKSVAELWEEYEREEKELEEAHYRRMEGRDPP
jgi:bifunctional DNA-binding transcriptional regulator/antitoxin component of YhaV-PrlF toxin-antitoxin module